MLPIDGKSENQKKRNQCKNTAVLVCCDNNLLLVG